MTLPFGRQLISQRESTGGASWTPTNAVRIAASNTDQLNAWDGDEGAYWAARADYFRPVGSPLPTGGCSTRRPSPMVIACLDIGCGTGQTTPARRPHGDERGRHSAWTCRRTCSPMRGRRGYPTKASTMRRSRQADGAGSTRSRRPAFDVAISNTGATFFRRPRGGLPQTSAARWRARWTPHAADVAVVPEQRMGFASSVVHWLAGAKLPDPRPPMLRAPLPCQIANRVRDVLTNAGFVDNRARRRERGHVVSAPTPKIAGELVLGLLGWMLGGLGRRRTSASRRPRCAPTMARARKPETA